MYQSYTSLDFFFWLLAYIYIILYIFFLNLLNECTLFSVAIIVNYITLHI